MCILIIVKLWQKDVGLTQDCAKRLSKTHYFPKTLGTRIICEIGTG
jgi:hypothetical protein